MKSNELLILGGVGLAVWYFGFGPGASSAQLPITKTTAPVQPLLSGGSLALPFQSAAGQNPPALPVPGSNTQAAQINGNPNATIAQQTAIFQWITWLSAADQAQFFNQWPYMTAADISGLMGLISSGGAQTPAQTNFWNQWRATYRIDI